MKSVTKTWLGKQGKYSSTAAVFAVVLTAGCATNDLASTVNLEPTDIHIVETQACMNKGEGVAKAPACSIIGTIEGNRTIVANVFTFAGPGETIEVMCDVQGARTYCENHVIAARIEN